MGTRIVGAQVIGGGGGGAVQARDSESVESTLCVNVVQSAAVQTLVLVTVRVLV